MPTYDLAALFAAATPEDRDTCATTFASSVSATDLVRARPALIGPALHLGLTQLPAWAAGRAPRPARRRRRAVPPEAHLSLSCPSIV